MSSSSTSHTRTNRHKDRDSDRRNDKYKDCYTDFHNNERRFFKDHRHNLTRFARNHSSFNLAQFPQLYAQYFNRSLKSVYTGKTMDLILYFDDLFGIDHDTYRNRHCILSKLYDKHHPRKYDSDTHRHRHNHYNDKDKKSESPKAKPTPKSTKCDTIDSEQALRNFEKYLSQKPTVQNVQVISYQPIIIQQPSNTPTNIVNVINTSNAIDTGPPLKKQKLNNICGNCQKRFGNAYGGYICQCNKCKIVIHYCGNICRSKHWNVHQNKECKQNKDSLSTNVENWNHLSIIYWLNRVNNGEFKGIECRNLRKGIFMAKIDGTELAQLNSLTLRMSGIQNTDKQRRILGFVSDLLARGTASNELAQQIKTNMIPRNYVDAMTFELMEEPIRIKRTGLCYDREHIEPYINKYHQDPITKQEIGLSDMIVLSEVKRDITAWKKHYFDYDY